MTDSPVIRSDDVPKGMTGKVSCALILITAKSVSKSRAINVAT